MDFSDLGGQQTKQGKGIDFSDLGGVRETPWSEVPANAIEDIKGIPKSVANVGKRLADPFGLAEAIGTQSLEPIKKATMEPLETAKGFAQSYADLATQPIEHFKKHPVGTAMEVAPLVAPFIPKGVPKVGEAPMEAPPMAEAPKIAPEVPPKISPPPAEAPKTFGDLASKVKSQIPKEILDPAEQVKQYLQNKYGEASKKPGFANTMSDYIQEHSKNMDIKDIGFSNGQIRKMGGTDKAYELVDYARENNLVGPKVGTIGRKKMIETGLENSGGAVGAFRKMAADRGAVHNPTELVKQVRSQLDSKYLTKGIYRGQKRAYLDALDEIQKANPRAENVADKVTELFQEAKNQDPLRRPVGPSADVARIVRKANHDLIAQHLKSEEMNVYEKALEDYGALRQIGEGVKLRDTKDAGGRLGPGSGISRMAVQKFLDAIGYRTQARIMDRLSNFIRENPELATRPKEIFRKYAEEAAEAIDEMSEGRAAD